MNLRSPMFPREGRNTDVQVIRVDRPDAISLKTLSEEFVNLLASGREGLLRLPEAAMQNHMLRGLLSAQIHANSFFPALKRAGGAYADTKNITRVRSYDRYTGKFEELHVTIYMNRVESGVRNMVNIITARQALAQNLLQGTCRYWGTNDMADASSQVDLFEFDSLNDANGVPMRVDRVALIQAKSPGVNVAPKDISNGEAAHQKFVESISDYQGEENARIRRIADRLLPLNAGGLPPLHEDFFDLLLRPNTQVAHVANHAGVMTRADQLILSALCARTERMREYAQIFDIPEQGLVNAEALSRAYLEQNPLTVERARQAGIENGPRIFSATRFESLFMSGKTVVNTRVLNAGQGRLLTDLP